jgi:hypothetical protein
MKKNDWILIIATALYSYLFYREAAGINFFIFSIGLIALLLARGQELRHKKKWLIVAAGTCISGAAVAIYGNWLSLWANVISLMLLSGMSVSTRSSVIMTLFHSAYSAGGAIVFMVLDAIERKPASQSSQRSPFYVKVLLVLVPLLITLLFFFLYRGSNPIFNNFAKNLSLDFITWQWIFFTLLGFILLYGFFYHKRIKELAGWDENAPGHISPREVDENGAGLFGIRNQNMSGILMFAMLNVLLLVVNALDVQYVFIAKTLPPGLNHSENVHQGVDLLILSIIIAIAIILFVFRGDMNFYSKNKMLRLLAYAWIIQNIFMIVSTMMRNSMYIAEHGLTYKRIGVYVYLALAIIGLAATWIKIMRIRSNWFLFRVNTAVWYVLLVISPVINWDKLIVDHNLTHARTKAVDKGYLIELAPATLVEMLAYNDSTSYLKEEREIVEYNSFEFIPEPDRIYTGRTLESKLHGKLYFFLKDRQELGWQSWNYDDSRIKRDVLALSAGGKIKHLSLGLFGLRALLPLEPISRNVTSLDVRSCQLGRKMEGLALFTGLEKLDLSSNAIDSLDMFPSLPRLKELDLSGNGPMRSVKGLKNAPALSVLSLASCTDVDISELPSLPELTFLDLSRNVVRNVPDLSKFSKLRELSLANSTVSFYAGQHFPAMPSLRRIDLSHSSAGAVTNNDVAFGLLEDVVKCPHLEEIDISDNNLPSVKPITATTASNTWLKELKTLNLQNNQVIDLSGIENLSSLTSLDIAYNKIGTLAPLATLTNLKILNASGNPLKDMSALQRLTQLEHLELANVKGINSSDLSALLDLRWLNLSGTGLIDTRVLKGMRKMENLYLQNNQLTTIDALKEMKNLRILNISGNRITDYSSLYRLRQLKELYIDPVKQSTMDALKKELPGTKITVVANTYR